LKLVSAVAVASCLLMVVLFFGFSRRERHVDDQIQSDMAATSETVDLSNVGTFRGNQPTPLQAVSLPAALVKATIILPRYSEPGKYAVSVTRDQGGSDLLARAIGTTNGKDRAEVAVILDLRKSPPGSYFLSTTHEQDQASYYYPLQIK
jgi:hypothetical protein